MEILLVEDNAGDVGLMRECFKKVKTPLKIQVVVDGEQAVDYLRKKGQFSLVATPNLVLLDMSLPKLSGKEVLKEIKGDAKLRCIPIIVLSSSASEIDRQDSLQSHANAYIVKPQNLTHLYELGNAIENFWLSVAL